MDHLDRLHIEIDLFREKRDKGAVLVCFSEDYHSEQRHLVRAGTGVSACAVAECLAKICRQIIERSAFNDASSPRTTQAFPEALQEWEA